MPSQIVWLPAATKDVERLRKFIKSDNPRAAQRAAIRIVEGVNILRETPEAGVPVENFVDYRDLVLTYGSGEYIIRYHLDAEGRVVIIRVRHSKEEVFK